MSIYCTLPRTPSKQTGQVIMAMSNQSNGNVSSSNSYLDPRRCSWTSDTSSASTFVDELFDPILSDVSSQMDMVSFSHRPPPPVTTSNYSRQSSTTSSMGNNASYCPSPSPSTDTMTSITNGCVRSAQSELYLSGKQSSDSSSISGNHQFNQQRLYYAVDSFADLKALRRSSQQLEQSTGCVDSNYIDSSSTNSSRGLNLVAPSNLPPSNYRANSITSPLSSEHNLIDSKPNFYGEPVMYDSCRSSSSDSAYDSSNESLKSKGGRSQSNASSQQLAKSSSNTANQQQQQELTFAQYKKQLNQSSSSKYFTLPSKLGRKLKKQLSETSLGVAAGNRANQGPGVSSRVNSLKSGGANTCVTSPNNGHSQYKTGDRKVASVQRADSLKTSLSQLSGQAFSSSSHLPPVVEQKASSVAAYPPSAKLVLPTAQATGNKLTCNRLTDSSASSLRVDEFNCAGNQRIELQQHAHQVQVGSGDLYGVHEQHSVSDEGHCCCRNGCHFNSIESNLTCNNQQQQLLPTATNQTISQQQQLNQKSLANFHCCSSSTNQPMNVNGQNNGLNNGQRVSTSCLTSSSSSSFMSTNVQMGSSGVPGYHSAPTTPCLETVWEDEPCNNLKNAFDPHAMQLVSMSKDSLESLQGQMQRLQVTLQQRDMEVARLKTALYTITAYGDTIRPSDTVNSGSKNWLSKAFAGSKSSKAKGVATGQQIYGTIGGQQGHQTSTLLSNMSNGRLVIDELKRQLQESDRRMFEMRTQLAASNSQVTSLSKVLDSTRDDLQSVVADNERLKRELAAVSSSPSNSQRYESSFTISSQGRT